MLRIHIGSITEQGLNLDERTNADTLPLLSAIAGDGTVSFPRPIHVRIRGVFAGETILIDGTAASTARIQCGRCLEPFEKIIEADFSFMAVPKLPLRIKPDTDDDIEILAADIDVVEYSGDSIELNHEVAQQIIMALPFKPLCRKGCKGLCVRCGVDLNHYACQCHPQDETSPFTVLGTHRFPKRRA
jgi:uncharacterized protein